MGNCCITQGARLALYDDLEGWDRRKKGHSQGRGDTYTHIYIYVYIYIYIYIYNYD